MERVEVGGARDDRRASCADEARDGREQAAMVRAAGEGGSSEVEWGARLVDKRMPDSNRYRFRFFF
jgi:hypothetical protein